MTDSSITNVKLKKINFVIQIEEDEWSKIKPIDVQDKDRITKRLQGNWGDLIVSKVRKKCGIPCPFKFKKQQFFKKQALPWFIFIGYCKTCGAKIHGKCEQRSEDVKSVKVIINTFDTKGIDHGNDKRPLTNERRQEAKKVLKYEKPTLYKHKEANRLMNDSGTESQFLNSTFVYSKVRQEAKDEEMGLKNYPGNLITSLLLMMNAIPSIRFLSIIPLYVWYWSQNQLSLWNNAANMDIPISIDASGRFVKKLNIFDDNNSSSIFLYNITIRIESKIYSICQMLSSRHNVANIFSWLHGWLQSGASTPKQVVVDCSLALLNGICLAFNKCTYNEYLSQCYKFLTAGNNKLPYCLVKRDRAHLIKAVVKWKMFNNDDWIKKDFYTRCIAYSLEIDDLALLKDTITAILVICQSQSIDEGSECYKRFQWLEEKIASFDYNSKYESILKDLSCEYETCNLINETNDQNDDIKDFINRIKINSQSLASNDENSLSPNSYYLPKLMDNLINLYGQFPAWTNVMHRFYEFQPNKVSTSTASECYYRIMRREYGFNCPVSLNRFILSHLPLIDGATKLGIGALKKIKNLFGLGTDVQIQSEQSTNVEVLERVLQKKVNINNNDNLVDNVKSVTLFVKKLFELRPFKDDINLALYNYNQEMSFLQEKDHILSLFQYRTLKPKMYVDGSVIDSYMIAKSNTEWKNTYFFPTSQTSFIVGEQADGEHPQTWKMYNIHFEFQGKVFIPYCYGAHWCLLMLSIDDQTIEHFDPLCLDRGNRAITAFIAFLYQCNSASENNLRKIQWKVRESSIQLPKQKDSYNCGIFIMYYMDVLAKNEKASLFFDPDKYRLEIAHFLMVQKESMKNVCLYCYKREIKDKVTCNKCDRWAHNKCITRVSTKFPDGKCELCAIYNQN